MTSVNVLRLTSDLALPLDTVTQGIGILAKRRAGKSFLARRLAEQFIKHAQQVVIIDPKGDWWGIRSKADGKGEGLKVVILGGEHGDIPLEVQSGEMVAQLAVEERVSMLLDLSLFRKHEVATFMTAFLETMYRLKAREVYRTPVMLIIDEADAIAPQNPMKGSNEERMVGAANDMMRRGGQRGIGVTVVTQRSAVLNKNVLTQVQLLITLRTIAPQDLAAINAWIDVHGSQEERKILMGSLPSMPIGEAWFWSPGWPTEAGIFERGKVLPIETFDSGATPNPGEKRREPKMVADIDLEAFRERMAGAIEKAKADDPKELRKRISELEKQIATPRVSEKTIEREVFDEAEAARLQTTTREEIESIFYAIGKALEEARKATHAKMANALGAYFTRARERVAHPMQRIVEPKRLTFSASAAVSTMNGVKTETKPIMTSSVVKGAHRMLTAIAQHEDGVTPEQLMVLTDYKATSRDTYVKQLVAGGFIERGADRMLRPTAEGLRELGPNFKPLPTGHKLREHYMATLPEGERRIFDVVCLHYPKAVHKTFIMSATNYKATSVDTYLKKLRARRLVESNRGEVVASDHVFGP